MASKDIVLAGLVFAPGAAFATSTALPLGGDASGAATAGAAVVLSGAVAAGVIAKPSRATYGIAFVWSTFSVIFELVQAKHHHSFGSDQRASVSLCLAVVRAAGVALSARLISR